MKFLLVSAKLVAAFVAAATLFPRLSMAQAAPAPLHIAVIGTPEDFRLRVEADILKSGEWQVVALSERPQILSELSLQQSGLIEGAAAQRVGNLLGVEYLAAVSRTADFAAIRIVHVQTGRLEALIAPGNDPAAAIRGLLRFLDSRAALTELARLPVSSDGIRVEVRASRSRLRIGEELELTIVSSLSGYLTLFGVQADGTIVLLLPNQATRAQVIRAGEPLHFPPAPLRLRIQPPIGAEYIYAIVSASPIDLPPADLAVLRGGPSANNRTGAQILRGFGLQYASIAPAERGVGRIAIETYE